VPPEEAVVDCEGCVAPCCSAFHPNNGRRGATADLIAAARRAWGDIPVTVERTLTPTHGVPRVRMSCGALAGGQCGVYDRRPTICRIYDCRTDPARYNDGARCEWPRKETQ
jgi:Fe-S-cluster containining protein